MYRLVRGMGIAAARRNALQSAGGGTIYGRRLTEKTRMPSFTGTAAPAHVFDASTDTFETEVLQKSLQVPVLVDFWAEWCGPCKTLGPILEKLAAEYNGAFLLAKVDVDKEQQLAAAFQVRSIPTVFLVKDGQLVDGFPGALPEGQLREFLKQYGIEPGAPADEAAAADVPAPPADPHAEVMRLRKAVEAEPDRAELRLDLALALLQTGGAREAEQLLDALPANLATDDRAAKARARLGFAALLQDAPPPQVLEAAIAANPGRPARTPPSRRAPHRRRGRRGRAGTVPRDAAAQPRLRRCAAEEGADRCVPHCRGRGPGRPLPAKNVVAAAGLIASAPQGKISSGAALNPRTLRRILNVWPPFLFSGIHVAELSPDWRHARVELRQRWYNRNYVGTHFGGSLFAMTDPFWMVMTMQALGRDFIVWDKAAEIEFVAPGRGTVHAEFHLDEAVLDELRAATAGGDKALRWFDTEVVDAQGDAVARIRKQLYVRRKRDR